MIDKIEYPAQSLKIAEGKKESRELSSYHNKFCVQLTVSNGYLGATYIFGLGSDRPVFSAFKYLISEGIRPRSGYNCES